MYTSDVDEQPSISATAMGDNFAECGAQLSQADRQEQHGKLIIIMVVI